jgi:hypothetical protein
MDYAEWHEAKLVECQEYIAQHDIETNVEYLVHTTDASESAFDPAAKHRLNSLPTRVHTRAYPYRDQAVSFVGLNPSKSFDQDRQITTADVDAKYGELLPDDDSTAGYIDACAAEWKEWLRHAQAYLHLPPILSNGTWIDATITSREDVRELIATDEIYDLVHFTNWFPLSTESGDEFHKFEVAAEFAIKTLTAELEIVDPDLICLCSVKAIRNLPLTECSLLADRDAYVNPPTLTLDGRDGIENVLGGIYTTDQFPAPVALLPHPTSLSGHPSWSIGMAGMKQRFATSLQALK